MSSMPPPLPPEPVASHAAPRGWWQRNWKWAAPLMVITAFALLAGAVGALVLGVRGSLLASDVYADAVARARHHPEVAAALGDPISEGFMPSGSISKRTTGGGSGEAELMIELSGPNGSGMVNADAHRVHGRWVYRRLVFIGPDQEIVALAQDGDSLGAPPAQ